MKKSQGRNSQNKGVKMSTPMPRRALKPPHRRPPDPPNSQLRPSFSSSRFKIPSERSTAEGSGLLRFLEYQKFPNDKVRFFETLHTILVEANGALFLKGNGEISIYSLTEHKELGVLGQISSDQNNIGPIRLDSDVLMLDRERAIEFLDILLEGASAVPPKIKWKSEFPELERYVVSLNSLLEPTILQLKIYLDGEEIRFNLHRLLYSCGEPQRQS